MKGKKIVSLLTAGVLVGTLLAGCGNSTSSGKPASSAAEEQGGSAEGKTVALALGDASDYYIGTMVGETVKTAFEEAGCTVQILDASSNVATQTNQIQNAVTTGVDLIYVFPAGDGASYSDVLNQAKEAGVKTLMSNNYPGDDVVDCFVGNDEFQMGVMMAKLVSDWAEETFPDAGAGEVPVLICESSFNENAIRRCLGMRMVGEKFLREADLAAIDFVSKDGDAVTYVDEAGNEQAVDEPTGGLILDEEGHAQLNPYYNEKVKIIEYSNRNTAGTDSSEAQKAVENSITMGETGLKAVMSYGDVGAAVDTKCQELISQGKITTSIDDFAVFCSDLTDTNQELILSDSSLLKGVMASGDLIRTVCDDGVKMVNGETVDEFTMMPLSYITANDDASDLETVYYTDGEQLPDTALFFPDSTM